MNKLFTKIAALCLGATMAVGVGVAVASNSEAVPVSAALNNTAVWSSGTPAFDSSYASGTKTLNGISWFVSCAGNNTSLGWNTAAQGGKNDASSAPLSTISQATKYGTYQSSGGWKVGKIVVSFSNADAVTGTWYIWYSNNNGSSWTQATTGSLEASTASITYDHGSNIGDSVRFAFGFGTTKTTKTRINISNIQVYKYDEVQNYTVSFVVNTAGYGTLSSSSIANVPSGSSITTNGNKVTINGTTVTATPSANTAQYTYAFSSWSNASGTITAARTITANFTRTTNTYSVNGTITNGSLSSTASVAYGSALNITINPDSGFTYPSSLTSVTMGGSAYAGYTYNSGTGAFSIASVTGAVVITATCPSSGASEYDINYSLSHCSISNPPATMYSDDIIELTIVPADHYKLPGESANKVSVTGAVDWRYDDDDGTITIDGAEDDLTVSVECIAKETFDVNLSLTNVTKTSGPSGTDSVEEGEEVTIVFAGSGNYGLPASITVTMGGDTLVDNDDYVWTQETGTLWLMELTGDLSVTIVGEAKTLLSISFSPDSGSYTLGDDFVKPTVTATYNTGAETVTDTENISYSGYDPYSATVQYVTISYGGKTATSTYKATVSAASVETTTTWELTALADLTSSDEFVIARTSGTTVALPSDGGASKPTVSSVTISNNKITSTVTDSLLWNVSGNASDGYVFNPKGDTSTWLYLLDDSNDGVRIGSGSNAANKHFTLEQGYLYSTETTSPRMIGVYNNADWRCYKLSSGQPATNIAGQTFGFFKKVETQSGQADLIRITASYTGGEKYVGDSISTSDFTVKKQLNTGDNLIDVASGYTISANTLASTSNTITVSYTEGKFTKTFDVVVPATERTVTLESVTLVQGQGVVKKYIDWSGAAWDYTGLTVDRTWSDASVEHLSLADLITAGNATVSPAKPASGITSFTVSYEYLEVSITNATVSGITVVEDYVTSISWTGTTAAHFKAFSGGQLTAAQVGAWSVVPTLAGAGVQSALSFGQYTLKVGNKTIDSLPYTWASEDDGQELSITYGKDENGDDFVKKNNTAVANICATINAIDHDEVITPAYDEYIQAYVKVTDIDDVTTGKYLIVYEGDSTHHDAALNGSLITSSIDANLNYQSITFDGDNIEIPASDNFYVTITKNTSDYTITTASGVNVGHSTGSNGFNKTGNNTISFNNNGSANITGTGGIKLQYNYASKTERFRYFASSQGAVYLYKYTEETIHHDAVTETTHYANDMDHFDAQKKVVEFAKFMNDTMNGTNVCSGTFANLESAWEDVADKYDKLFGAETTLNETELAWAKKMLEYASPVWGSDAEAACVEKAMKTYDYCISKYGLDEFLDGVRTVGRHPGIYPIAIATGDSTSTIAIIVIISMISVTTIGGYFFLRKRKEN